MNKIYSDKKFMNLASPILTHKEFLKTKSIVHHGNTRYNHSVRVAYTAYTISKILGGDLKATVRVRTKNGLYPVYIRFTMRSNKGGKQRRHTWQWMPGVPFL